MTLPTLDLDSGRACRSGQQVGLWTVIPQEIRYGRPMTRYLELEEYGEAIGNAAAVLRNNAVRAGLEASVPTCPGWTVRDLVTHLGRVYRAVAARVDQRPGRPPAEIEAEAASSDDLLGWFDDALVEVLNALGNAPDDLDIPFFIESGLRPRAAYARRMCHETTIHAVDAMAAALGRPPTPEQLWFRDRLAADGIDELIVGVATRATCDLRYPSEVNLTVAPDGEPGWTVHLGGDIPRTTPGVTAGATATVAGKATALYLALWNRGDDVTVTGAADVWRAWQTGMQI